ncbi:hypothetical protein [Streptomyces venezuelae]|uniref:hypothetical protein n=1 Tax=Streptomyces venezuelae TaxID=54571 RepID=UPI0037969280
MSYDLKAVIAHTELLTTVTAPLPHAKVTRLRHGLSLMPVTEALLNTLAPKPHGLRTAHTVRTVRTGFWSLTTGLAQHLAGWSAGGAMAYVESEYWAGVGEENAVVWRAGSVVLSPLHLREDEAAPAEGTPVCRVLRELGITAVGIEDEFTIAGLGDHRDTEGWLGA